MPVSVADLNVPPFREASFLPNGKSDTIDPWGKTYRLTLVHQPDGIKCVLVQTTAPDGVQISQFGIGAEKAFPKFLGVSK
ncbi:hypothetical protein J8F10_05155 [Gemmata sp. G18]|uniref:Uncharacterized protein n=1 Tax=Gemmata palustris TaxID=2822762 RepID=A0ABS5BLT1_9BACT|nr:hypothetical protein [Gemmata palustris]MBP3954670.1 hypothetical protein [Gemmata palustris]